MRMKVRIKLDAAMIEKFIIMKVSPIFLLEKRRNDNHGTVVFILNIKSFTTCLDVISEFQRRVITRQMVGCCKSRD